MKIAHILTSFVVVILGMGFIVDSAADWDNFAVIAIIAGWAVTMTGVLHLLVALDREGSGVMVWLAVASSLMITIVVVLGWTFATFSREWPEVSAVSFLMVASVLSMTTRHLRSGAVHS